MRKSVGLLVISIAILITACGSKENSVKDEQSETSNKDVPIYLYWQYYYADKKGIELNIEKEQDKIFEWISEHDGLSDSVQYVRETGSLFSSMQYKLSANVEKYYYQGETKDNLPDGFGMLSKPSSFAYELEDIIYIGEFKEGRFDGYGLLFAEPTSEDATVLGNLFSNDYDSNEFKEYYHSFVNYVSYEGEFKKGEATGEGNNFYCGLYYSYLLPGNKGMTFDPSEMDYIITVGSFKNGKANGNVKKYVSGYLYYDGEMEDGDRSGKGRQYFIGTNILEYEGEFKGDERHGSGTLYNENGQEIYSGEWKNGNYA